MKVVIELSKEEMEAYKNVMRIGFGNSAMRKIINGTPLPEGAEILTKEAYSDLCLRASQERKTDTCTNDGKDCAETDQFVCSKCGIELLDWTRYIGDECYEYAFKFCPNCGSRIEKGAEDDGKGH